MAYCGRGSPPRTGREQVMVESPQRIWIEANDECPYFYEAHELHDVEEDVIEYVRADLYVALEAQLAETTKELSLVRAERDRAQKACEQISARVSPGPEAQQEPHEVLHIYEGDGGVVVREIGNISTFGTLTPAVLAAFEAASDVEAQQAAE